MSELDGDGFGVIGGEFTSLAGVIEEFAASFFEVHGAGDFGVDIRVVRFESIRRRVLILFLNLLYSHRLCLPHILAPQPILLRTFRRYFQISTYLILTRRRHMSFFLDTLIQKCVYFGLVNPRIAGS